MFLLIFWYNKWFRSCTVLCWQFCIATTNLKRTFHITKCNLFNLIFHHEADDFNSAKWVIIFRPLMYTLDSYLDITSETIKNLSIWDTINQFWKYGFWADPSKVGFLKGLKSYQIISLHINNNKKWLQELDLNYCYWNLQWFENLCLTTFYQRFSSNMSQPDALRLPVFSLGQLVCGEKPCGGFVSGATTATPATLLEPFFSFIMTDLRDGNFNRGKNHVHSHLRKFGYHKSANLIQ